MFSQLSNFIGPLFSYSYELLFPQPLCFDIHPHCPGVSPSSIPDAQDVPTPTSANSFVYRQLQPLCSLFPTPILYFQSLAASFPKTPGWGYLCDSSALSASRRYRLPSFSFLLCFHTLTNPFSCNSFLFTSIQNPRGATLQRSRFSDLQTVQIRHRRSLGLCSVYTQSDSFLPRRRADISNRTAVKRRGGFA